MPTEKDQNVFDMMRIAYAECGEHCKRVAVMVNDFCKYMKVDTETRHVIRTAAMFHDIGKLSVPKNICQKPGTLSHEEWLYMKAHVIFSADFLRHLGYSEEICDIVLHHHERWDGNGYTDSESNHSIPFGSRVIAICDSYDAMRYARCYRDPVSEDDALKEILLNAGKMYDPVLVSKFLEFRKEIHCQQPTA